MNTHTQLVCHKPPHSCLGDSPCTGSDEEGGDEEDSTGPTHIGNFLGCYLNRFLCKSCVCLLLKFKRGWCLKFVKTNCSGILLHTTILREIITAVLLCKKCGEVIN